MFDLLNSIKDEELKEYLLEATKANNKIRNSESALTIGVMGKSGAGKSSIINTLCQTNLCKSGAVGGCTREIQKIPAKIAEMDVCLIDFPGIAENEEWDKSYLDLYHSYLDKLDIILWVIKIDDRAVLEDEKFYKNYLSDYEIRQKCIFVLSQSDKVEPSREWDRVEYRPSHKQLDNIKRNKFRIHTDFDIPAMNILSVSTDYNNGTFQNYNFESMFDVILFRLANNSKVSNELSVDVSWKITQREFKKEAEFTKYAMEMMREEAEKAMESLKKLMGSF